MRQQQHQLALSFDSQKSRRLGRRFQRVRHTAAEAIQAPQTIACERRVLEVAAAAALQELPCLLWLVLARQLLRGLLLLLA